MASRTIIRWRRRSTGASVAVSRRAVYTYYKSLDNSFEHLTGGGSNSFPQDARNYNSWYGPSDFDVRHRFVINGIWELPFGRAYMQEGVGAAILGGGS